VFGITLTLRAQVYADFDCGYWFEHFGELYQTLATGADGDERVDFRLRTKQLRDSLPTRAQYKVLRPAASPVFVYAL